MRINSDILLVVTVVALAGIFVWTVWSGFNP